MKTYHVTITCAGQKTEIDILASSQKSAHLAAFDIGWPLHASIMIEGVKK